MSKLFAAIFAAMFALGTVSAFAADKGKGDEKKVEAKAKAKGDAKKTDGKAKAAAKKDEKGKK